MQTLQLKKQLDQEGVELDDQLRQTLRKVEEMTEDINRAKEENETYRKFFVLNMAYTKAHPN